MSINLNSVGEDYLSLWAMTLAMHSSDASSAQVLRDQALTMARKEFGVRGTTKLKHQALSTARYRVSVAAYPELVAQTRADWASELASRSVAVDGGMSVSASDFLGLGDAFLDGRKRAAFTLKVVESAPSLFKPMVRSFLEEKFAKYTVTRDSLKQVT